MECNYDRGIKNMRDIANSWKFRYLTIFGKLTVIKMFLLLQLTHVATVVPTLTAKQIEEIHSVWNEFIHVGSPNVVNVKTIYTPKRENGLGLHKVADFWGAVKLSWMKRLPYSKSLWMHLHREEAGSTMFNPMTYDYDMLCAFKKKLKKKPCGQRYMST